MRFCAKSFFLVLVFAGTNLYAENDAEMETLKTELGSLAGSHFSSNQDMVNHCLRFKTYHQTVLGGAPLIQPSHIQAAERCNRVFEIMGMKDSNIGSYQIPTQVLDFSH
jgi:hypothetical protein